MVIKNSMKPIITIYSDNVCPFCCIASRRLEKLRNEIEFEIRWEPFELHPEVPPQGIAMDAYFKGKAEEMLPGILDYSKDVNLRINTKYLYNSRNSLKLGEYAKTQHLHKAWHKAIHKAYLEDALNIAEQEVLLHIAEAVGLDRQEALRYMHSREAEEKVAASKNRALQLGITSVPSIIINNNLIRGAYPYDTLKQMFKQALQG